MWNIRDNWLHPARPQRRARYVIGVRALRVLDPRVLLLWLACVIVGVLVCGDIGLGAGLGTAFLLLTLDRALYPWLRLLRTLAPLAILIVLLDLLAGSPYAGIRTAARLVTLASVGQAFGRIADGERLLAGLTALHVPFSVSFVLIGGARAVPQVRDDLGALRDAARLRGIALDGPPWRQFGGWRRVLVPLLVATIRRGMQLGEAMEARAFGAATRRTPRGALAWSPADSLAALAAVLYLAGCVAGSLALPRLAG